MASAPLSLENMSIHHNSFLRQVASAPLSENLWTGCVIKWDAEQLPLYLPFDRRLVL